MGALLRLVSCAAIVGLLGSSLRANMIVFSDDFESGNLSQWTQGSGSQTALTISTSQNSVPVGGQYSALIDNSSDRMYHNLGSDANGHILFTTYIYDDYVDAQPRAFSQMAGYSGAGYQDGDLQQTLAIGKYNAVTMSGETFDAGKYKGRVVYPSASMGWFNLDAAGSPDRSLGWHRFDIEVMPNGTDINFYVDGILSRAITGAKAATYDSVVIGLGVGTVAGDAWVDGISVSIVPEPATLALLALGGLALIRRRRN